LSKSTPDCLLNGYKRYISDDPANTRNVFYAGDSASVGFEIKPTPVVTVFGYAVDSCWAKATNIPVVDPITDFPLSANCEEPWKITVTEDPIGIGLTDEGGSTELIIDVHDWQGKETHEPPVIECPEIFTGTLTAEWIEDGVGYSRWDVTIENTGLPPAGTYSCLVSVEDHENDPVGKPWLDLTAYQLINLKVKSNFEPIEVTPPDLNLENANDVVVSNGYAYVTRWLSILDIVDVSIPEEAHVVKSLEFDGEGFRLDVQGDYAYVVFYNATDENGMRVIDISDPANASIVTSVLNVGNRVDVCGGYALTNAGGVGIQIHDIDPPESAHYIKHIQLPGQMQFLDIRAEEGYGYAVDSYTLYVIDTDPPEQAEFVAELAVEPYMGWDLDTWGNYVYKVHDSGIAIIDVTSPSSPQFICHLITSEMPFDVEVVDGIAYIMEYEQMQIVDVTTPLSSVLLKQFDISPCYEIAVDGDYLYTASSVITGDKMRIYKVW
jgi:hypothetical protein